MGEQSCVVCGEWMEFDDSVTGYVVCWKNKCREEYPKLRKRLIKQNPMEKIKDWTLLYKKKWRQEK